MSQRVELFVGFCDVRLKRPYVASALVACEAQGCTHKVWCDSRLQPAWAVLKVVCDHCVESQVPKVAS